MLVIDIQVAFWHIPNHPAERKYFVARAGRHYIIFRRTAQGSRNAALTWATVAALVARCVQSLFLGGAKARSRTMGNLMLQVYVDDPFAVMRGQRRLK